ncbi:MAG: hypothetical protein GY820_14315, partial [Gammaproteobacteria bacterium]|nr:hypothetical protein [Gammaproteobacteria bacterium]
ASSSFGCWGCSTTVRRLLDTVRRSELEAIKALCYNDGISAIQPGHNALRGTEQT